MASRPLGGGEARPVDSIGAAELRAWLLELLSTLSPESVAGYVRGLKAFGNWCASEEIARALALVLLDTGLRLSDLTSFGDVGRTTSPSA